MNRCLVLLVAASGALRPHSSMAQTNQTEAARWLAHAELAPPFKAPGSKKTWEKRRLEIRAQLNELLGKLPPRPKAPAVTNLLKEDRGEYWLEKFEFDNGAG